MATEEPAPLLTLKERIAALQLTSGPIKPLTPNSQKSPLSPYQTDRKKPPPSLPPRRPSQPISATPPPALPPRRSTDIIVNRKKSNESISSIASGRSSTSALSARPSFNTTLNGNAAAGPKFRIKAPEYDPVKLPALPERRSQNHGADFDTPSISKPTISVPERPTRPDQKAVLPPPTLPVKRRMPFPFKSIAEVPSEPNHSALQPGLDKAASPPPIPATRPQLPSIPPQSHPNAALSPASLPLAQQSCIVELDANSFDEFVLHSGKPAFVDFYAPFCKYCKTLDPIYEQLAIKYSQQNITIAKIDSYGQKSIGDRYQVEGWPTLKFFDGSGGPPIDYDSGHDLKWMSIFIDERLEKLAPSSGPPIQPSGVIELDTQSFDNVVLYSGNPVFVDFYGTFCQYCKDLDPIYEQLALKYAGQNITLAKIDSYTHKEIGWKYEVESWPTLMLFDGKGGDPVTFRWKRDLEWLSRFLDEELEKMGVGSSRVGPPPVPMKSKPRFV